MSASLNLPSLSRLWVYAERLNNYRAVRAVVRAGAGSMPVGALSAALQDLSDAVGSDRMIDLGIAAASIGAFVGLMHWIGRGRGGIVAGLKLSVVSWLFLQALTVQEVNCSAQPKSERNDECNYACELQALPRQAKNGPAGDNREDPRKKAHQRDSERTEGRADERSDEDEFDGQTTVKLLNHIGAVPRSNRR